MNLSDKLLQLRKENNMTQEELAEKLSVSRQSVSKWESGLSVPDLSKTVAIADLFSISLDELLRNQTTNYPINSDDSSEQENQNYSQYVNIDESEMNEFLSDNARYSKFLGFAVFLCIISPTVLIILSSNFFNQNEFFNVFGNISLMIGMAFLFISVAIGVGIMISQSMKMEKYKYIEKGDFEISSTLKDQISELDVAQKNSRIRTLVISVSLFILSPLPVVFAGLSNATDEIIVFMVVLLLFLVGIGVMMLITSETQTSAFNQLLKQGEYQNLDKKEFEDKLASVYWPIVVLLYFIVSFSTSNWSRTWIIWPIATILFGIIVNSKK